MIINTIYIAFSIVISGAILALSDWRLRLLGLAFAQLIGFILILQIWPIALASVKLISGWMAVVVLSATMAATSSETSDQKFTISANVFKLMLAAFSWVAIAAVADNLISWLPISFTNLFVGLVFLFCGIFFMSLFTKINDIAVGLLIFLSGFDIIYSSLEGSALVTGIYALIVILVSLVCSFLSGGMTIESLK